MLSVLLVEINDDVLMPEGIELRRASTAADAAKQLRVRAFDLIVADQRASPLVEFQAVTRLAHLTPIVLVGSEPGVVSVGDLAAVVEQLADRSQPSQTSSTLIRRYFTCLERGSWDELGDLCADDIRYLAPETGEAPRVVVQGRARFLEFTRETFTQFVEPRFLIDSVRDVAGGVIVRYRTTWLDPQRSRIGFTGAMFVRCARGLIEEVDVRLDLESLQRIVDLPAL